MADLQRMTIDDLRHWYESWYAPNNATLVVVGDVTADEVKTLAKRYFGEIPWRQLPPARKPLELAEPGERRLKLYVRTQLPNLIMGFNVPSLGSSENPREVNALRLIGALLDGGYSARLASRLERGEELVAGASTYYDAFNRGDSLFVLSATPNVQKGKTLEQVEAGLWKQLDDLKQNPPSAAEIERVRADDRRDGLREGLHRRPGQQHRPAGKRRPVLEADRPGPGGPQGSDSGRYPESRPHLFHPVAPDPGASAACEGRGKGGPS